MGGPERNDSALLSLCVILPNGTPGYATHDLTSRATDVCGKGQKTMNPFKIGDKYQNRDGEYEVISIDGPKMVIRYSDGRVVETTVQMQERIRRNIQLDENTPREVEGSRRSHPKKRRSDKRGQSFEGLQSDDFQKGVAGTSWRSRESLGGLLARKLSNTTGQEFQSYSIYRRAELHIAQPGHYHKSIRWREGKFVLKLDSERAWYGFYIERSDETIDDTWDWQRFIASLGGDEALQRSVWSAMTELDLHWDVYFESETLLVARVTPADGGLRWEPTDETDSETMSWPDFATRLSDLRPGSWCDLYLCKYMVKDDAITAGMGLADEVTRIYQTLIPLYRASVG